MNLYAVGPLDGMPPETLGLVLARGGDARDIAADVAPISRAVRERGDAALFEFTEKFDGARLRSLEVPRAAWDAALARIPAELREALEAARANIARFHEACMPKPVEIEVVPGVRAGRRVVPLQRVGAYVPGGRAAYPSTVLMTVVPAKVAGVDEVVVVTPPGKDGRVPDATLAACAIAGADRVFAVGGAQAVFALAYGTDSIPRVDKIVGPGNAYVAAAKAMVAAEVAIDSPAGPSEVLILLDDAAEAPLAAREMLAQAEHDPRAACVTVANSREAADAVVEALDALLPGIERAEVVRESLWSRGAVFVANDAAEMLAFSEAYAPEHLVLLLRDPREALRALRHYGSAFLGPHASVALGDYCSGPNHVLPTGGLARSYDGLGVEDFLRRPTHQEVTSNGLAALAGTTMTLARFEGLPNHAAAVEARRPSP